MHLSFHFQSWPGTRVRECNGTYACWCGCGGGACFIRQHCRLLRQLLIARVYNSWSVVTGWWLVAGHACTLWHLIYYGTFFFFTRAKHKLKFPPPSPNNSTSSLQKMRSSTLRRLVASAAAVPLCAGMSTLSAEAAPPFVRAPSSTAVGVAVSRAVHQVADSRPLILHDPVSALLVGKDRVDTAVASAADDFDWRLRAHVILRSRYAEDRLKAAVQRGVKQVCVLGAGLDTFAYRQPDWAKPLRLVLEVDHPASQATKRALLKSAGIVPPANVKYTSIDFATTSLAEGLKNSDLNLNEPVFFIFLGVMMYLDSPAIDAVFKFVRGCRPGSEMTFSFSVADPKSVLSEAAVAWAAAQGEPLISRHDPNALETKLRDMGFSEVHLLRPTEAKARYWAGRKEGGDALQPPEKTSVGTVVV